MKRKPLKMRPVAPDVARVSASSPTKSKSSMEATDSVNLRRCDDKPRAGSLGAAVPSLEMMEPVGVPATVVDEPMKPVCEWVREDGVTSLIGTIGSRLVIIENRGVGGEPRTLATLRGEVYCAFVRRGSRRAEVVTSKGSIIVVLRPDGRVMAVDRTQMPPFPVVVLSAEEAGNESAPVESRKLSEPNSGNRLSARDEAAIGDDLGDAYRRLSRQARRNGSLLQPVMARCRFSDNDGATVFVSPSVAVMLPEGFQCRQPVSVQAQAPAEALPAYSLDGLTYRVAVALGESLPEEWRELCSTVEVQVSHQLHPFDPKAKARVNVNRGSGDSLTFTLPLPGASDSARLSAAAVNAADHDEMWHTLARMPVDRLAVGTPEAIACAAPLDIDAEIDAVARLRPAREPTPDGELSLSMRCPHTFTARGVATDGQTVVWHSPTAHRFAGYAAGCYALATTDARWEASIKVTFTTGEQTVWSGQGLTGAPALFGPVVSYPSADAESLTLWLRLPATGMVYRRRVELTPTPGRTAAVWVNPSLSPWMPEAVDEPMIVPSSITEAEEHPEVVMAANMSDPCEPLLTATTGCGAVSALVPGRTAASSWNPATPVYYVFTRGGILAMSLHKDLRGYRWRRIDPRSVDTAAAVALTDGGVTAIASGDLVSIDRLTVSTLMADTGAQMLAWTPRHRELWLIDGQSHRWPALVVGEGTPAPVSRRDSQTCPLPQALLQGADTTYALAGERLLDLDRETPAAVSIRWSATCRAPGHAHTLEWTLHSPAINGAVEISPSHGAQPYAPAQRVAIDGRLQSTLRIPLFLRPCRVLTITLEATAAGATRIGMPRVYGEI